MKSQTHSHNQLNLDLPLDPVLLEDLLLKKARDLYRRSRFLNNRYASFSRLMEDPIAGRCMRLSAKQLLHLGKH